MIFNFKKGFDNNKALPLQARPIIAVSANIMNENSALHFAYSQAVVEADAIPIIIPANCDGATLRATMRGVDGLLLSGGADIDARYFGEDNIPNLTDLDEDRDCYEFMLLRAAIDSGIPILGICRGCQVINIALGGSIYQDLPTQYPDTLLPHSILENRHLPVHEIEIEEDSLLYKIVGKRVHNVNSRHHQAIKAVAPTLKVTARSTDGVIEAVESATPVHNIIAVQFHPENLATLGGQAEMKRLFQHLSAEANIYRRARKLHHNNPIVDSHCDTPMLYNEGGFDFSIRNSNAQVDLPKMNEGVLDATITVAYIPQKTAAEEAFTMAQNILTRFRKDLEKLSDRIVIAKRPRELYEAKARGLKCVMLGVENGLAIGDELDNINRFKSDGIVYITLCHNGANQICDSAVGEEIYNGVSKFGADVIERMNSQGITIDVSHSSHKSTMDAIRLSRQPVIASHSSCRALCDHPRNLSDEAMIAIAKSGGVVQICGYGGFLRQDGVATIHDLIQHIEYAVKLIGYDSVGVGSDFDGGGGVDGFNAANDFKHITCELLRRGHSEENIAKIMGGNILRILELNANNI